MLLNKLKCNVVFIRWSFDLPAPPPPPPITNTLSENKTQQKYTLLIKIQPTEQTRNQKFDYLDLLYVLRK